MHSIKDSFGVKTYAQNLCCGAAINRMWGSARYQSHSAAKLLIYIDFLNCFFYGQSSQSLDLKGLQRRGGNLSTKLSTENLENFKAPLNQVLSAVFACFSEDSLTIKYIS
jgi:hypothetical protein